MRQSTDPLHFYCGAGLVRLTREQYRLIDNTAYSVSSAYDRAVQDLSGERASAQVAVTLRNAVGISPDPWQLRAERLDRFGMIKEIEPEGAIIETADVVVECNGGDPLVKIGLPGYIDWWASIDWYQVRLFFEDFHISVSENGDSNRVTVYLDNGETEAFDSGYIDHSEALAFCRHLVALHGDRAFVVYGHGDDDDDAKFIDDLYKEAGNENE